MVGIVPRIPEESSTSTERIISAPEHYVKRIYLYRYIPFYVYYPLRSYRGSRRVVLPSLE